MTTLTKKMSEDLTDYLLEMGFKVRYLHSEIDTLERIQIIRELRLGEYDVLVGVNLLREGLDLPEVSLVAILDADKEGFLRGATSLIQTIGRAARNVDGKVLMYADKGDRGDAHRAGRDRPPADDPAGLQDIEHGITPARYSIAARSPCQARAGRQSPPISLHAPFSAWGSATRAWSGESPTPCCSGPRPTCRRSSARLASQCWSNRCAVQAW